MKRNTLTIRGSQVQAMENQIHVFLVGGYGNGDYQKGCLRYNVTTDSWDEMPELNFGRSRASCLYIKGRIYAIGGLGAGGVPIKSIERLAIVNRDQ